MRSTDKFSSVPVAELMGGLCCHTGIAALAPSAPTSLVQL